MSKNKSGKYMNVWNARNPRITMNYVLKIMETRLLYSKEYCKRNIVRRDSFTI